MLVEGGSSSSFEEDSSDSSDSSDSEEDSEEISTCEVFEGPGTATCAAR